ncbi:hypothetical protein BH09PLA1_BH09PLA1_24150 [soil metagenome]
MPIGNGNDVRRRTSAGEIRAKSLRFDGDRLIVVLADEREVSVPIEWYPSLRAASVAKRNRWTILNAGQAFHWPDLDLDLSVAGITNGLREAIPRAPEIEKKPRRKSA